MRIRGVFHFVAVLIGVAGAAWATPPLESLAQSQPYAPDHTWPALTAAQWTGDPTIDAVVILSIDDMREPAKYEAFLRPILDRLAAAGAPGALSIFTNTVDPADPQLQAWITEGLSIEAHTIKHPCPQLCQGNLAEAKKTYDDCVDLLAAIPNMRPVAARVPCCDSMNSASPRYFSEIFAGRTPGGHYLDIDSSVFCVFNPDDPSLPIELLHDPQSARGRFEKYLPFPAYTTTIANYPYPYIIGNTTWEIPCIVPSDWEAQHKNQPNAPETVADMKAAIDATVIKQGTYTLCFHPHKWIEAEQVASLIDHAQEKYGARVRFMSFAMAERLLREQLLGGPLRGADGQGSGPRLVDVNGDGYMDVFRGTGQNKFTGVWDEKARKWNDYRTNFDLSVDSTVEKTFASVEGCAVICRAQKKVIGWRFDDGWKKDKHLATGLEQLHGALRAIDIDHDGTDELVSANAMLRWNAPEKRWDTCAFTLPVPFENATGQDNGLRFVDLDEDRDYDLVYANETEYGVWLFDGFQKGWATEALRGARGSRPAGEELPPIVREGRENGFWTAKRTAWWHNEYTDTLPDRVDRRSFAQLLAQVKPRAKDVAEAVSTMRSPGRDVVAVAAEPLVRDPVCIAWDARGRLWTAEMRDYPLGLNNDGTPGSEIRVLDDTDHDGIYDKATVFLEGLAFADGVMPWRNGALITCAPEIFYAEDRDGDGKAEHREVLFEGFIEGNQQHRVNGLRWGGDGWIYAANGDSNGKIKSLKTGKVVDIRGRDLRFNPDTGELETVTGNAQFGRVRDDFGRWFGCANWSPMWAYTFDEHYQHRNPFLSVPDPRDFFIDSDRVFPASVVTERFNDQHMAGFFTSACGVEVYRDTRLGPKPEEGVDVFTCEPVHNLVFRARGHFDEGGFEGGRVLEEQASEFLASTDPWFRPVMVRTGPDGAIYVADMYRQIIEHPEYINEERQKELNLRAGEDEGRIWRVTPKGAALEAIPDLTARSTAELVTLLLTPNGALRDLVQQQIFERADAVAVPALKALAEEASAPAAARAAALWSLRMAGALEAATVAVALQAEDAGLALEALRLSDEFLAGDAAVQEAVLAVAARAQANAAGAARAGGVHAGPVGRPARVGGARAVLSTAVMCCASRR
jgi:putative membrane-bound dehydrogenase-like protein